MPETRRGSDPRPPGKEGLHLLLLEVWPGPSGTWPVHSDITIPGKMALGSGEAGSPSADV